jgi:hypothetical protein
MYKLTADDLLPGAFCAAEQGGHDECPAHCLPSVILRT